MALDTYSNLKAAIASHLDRDDLTPYLDDFIDLAEARHKRDIRIREMLTRGTLTVDSRYEDLPTGLLEVQYIRLLTSPVTALQFITQPEMGLKRREENGKPRYFTIGAQLEFDCAPDESYTADIFYFKAETALSDANTSNNLLTRAPDAYLYGALIASAPFLRNDERIEIWGVLYKSAVEGLSQSNKQERASGPLVSRVVGATP